MASDIIKKIGFGLQLPFSPSLVSTLQLDFSFHCGVPVPAVKELEFVERQIGHWRC